MNKPNNHKYKGFLLIELLVALGVFVSMTALLGKYQLQVSLYKKAAGQLHKATDLCSDRIEQIWAGRRKQVSKTEIVDEFKIMTSVLPGTSKAFNSIKVQVNWQSALGQVQKISMDAICVN